MMMSDRIAVMHQGRMWQVGSPREVYANPGNLFVSRFLRVSNELPGSIGMMSWKRSGSFTRDRTDPAFAVRVFRGQPVVAATLSLRPEVQDVR